MSNQDPPTASTYSIPVAYRKMENLHIVFWLFKDVSWCMIWKPLGIAMIFPTLIVSIVIAWRTRRMVSELCHNLAITAWISANSYWMISEFFHFDDHIINGHFTYKQLALVPFLTGMIILGYYYLWFKPRHKNEIETL
jgi:hypothetical protein